MSWQPAGSVAGRPNVCGLCCGLAWGCRIIRCADGRNLLAFSVNLKGWNGTICMCMNDLSMKEDGAKKIAKYCQVLPSPQEPCHKVLQQFLIQNIQNVGKIPQTCFASPPTPLVYHHVCSPCCDHDKATSQIVGSHDIQYVFLAGYILWDIITIIPYYIQYPLVWCCIVYIKGI